ncbi:MAG: hypothetical protein FJY75_01970 [Candidatus Eisenbacteria bacterium]|uniref:Tetratricopeptide repeat protein n=1 Tax=Eiseniibacteriota bacterium TaxID=2212470 RepID=A0A937X9D5_UNCEI|nr:hypothetical protein [Candidatus Eisenbacteria bacterium]
MSARRWRGAIAIACLGLWLPGGLAATAWAGVPHEVVESLGAAEQAYARGDNAAAVEAYRAVLRAGWESASLYYNLGSACHRAGEQGWAIAYLEQARRLAPRDADIRHNLALARRGAKQGAPQLETSWLLGLLAGMLDSVSPAGSVRLFLAGVWIAAFALAAAGWTGPALRRWGRRLVLASLLFLGAGLGLLALKGYQARSAPGGVVVAAEAEVRSGPLRGETVRFVLPAGTLVHLGRSAEGWREVWLSTEMRGWVSADELAALAPPRWRP